MLHAETYFISWINKSLFEKDARDVPAEKSSKLAEKIREESCNENEDSPEEEIPTDTELDNNDSVHTVKERENKEKSIAVKKKESKLSPQESVEQTREVYTKEMKEDDIFERAEQARKRAQKIRLAIFIFIIYHFYLFFIHISKLSKVFFCFLWSGLRLWIRFEHEDS